MPQTLALSGAQRRVELALNHAEGALREEAKVYEDANSGWQQAIWDPVFFREPWPVDDDARYARHLEATDALREAWATPAAQWSLAMAKFLRAESFALTEISAGRVPPKGQEERFAAWRRQEMQAEELGYDD